MFTLVLTIHILLCLAIVGLVLLQQGKGASVGVSFGGGSNTLFGAAGAGNVLTKATTACAVLFMISSLVLIKMYAGAGAERSAPPDPLKGSVMERSTTESTQSESTQSESTQTGSAQTGSAQPGAVTESSVPVEAPAAPPAEGAATGGE